MQTDRMHASAFPESLLRVTRARVTSRWPQRGDFPRHSHFGPADLSRETLYNMLCRVPAEPGNESDSKRGKQEPKHLHDHLPHYQQARRLNCASTNAH